MKDFFVSYNRADHSWAEWVAWQLEEAGYAVVIQAWDFRAGSNFVLQMQGASTDAERTIAVLSPNYLSALYTQPEWTAAFVQDPTSEKGVLLPVRVRECELKGLLRALVYIDLVGKDEVAARDALLAGVKRERAKPTTAPGFPQEAQIQRSMTEQPRFPGALPPIWNVPHQRNPNFSGREEHLEDLRKALSSGKAATLVQAIVGLDGVGKTQLALEYAYRYAADYDVVWWVNAQETVTLAGDYADLSAHLELPERGAQDQRKIVEAVRRRLEQITRWLLIFDSAGGAKDVRDYFPQSQTGHVLVTSHDTIWRGVARPLTLKALTRAESVKFLWQRTGQADETSAHALATELGDLPLALEQAGSYIEATGKSLADYLKLFRARQPEMLRRGQPSGDYDATVATTWEVSYQQVRQASPAAAELLHLCAFFAPDAIPRELVSNGTQHLPPSLAAAVGDELTLDDAVATLRRYSLIEVENHMWSIHQLVQAVVRTWLSDDDRKQWAEAAVLVVKGAFPAGDIDVRDWPACVPLLPQALATARHAEELKVTSGETSHLLNQVGMYLRGRARFAEAKELFERALGIVEAAYGPDHWKIATIAGNLGVTLNQLHDLDRARAQLERALRIDEMAYNPSHPKVAIDLNNLGSVLQDLGDLAQARAHYERALRIDEDFFGPDHPDVAIRLNNLGDLLRVQNDLAGALAYHERALKINETLRGPDHPSVAIDLHNRGNVLRLRRDLAGARASYERALRIDEAAYGPTHLAVARDVDSLGGVFYDLHDFANARAYGERALAIYRELLGENHPVTMKMRNNLSLLPGPEDVGSSPV